MSVSRTILQHLITTEEFGRKVFPFLSPDYFGENVDRAIFEIIADYAGKYNKFPSIQEVAIELVDSSTIDQIEFDEAKEFLGDIDPSETINIDWLVDKAEKFCQERAITLAIQKSASIITGEEKNLKKEAIPQLLQDALAISFKSSLGHDFLEDWEERFDYRHSDIARIPFHIDYLNKITGGGAPRKSLIVGLAGTGVGKTMLMCDMAAHHLMDGNNVLYLSAELSVEMISERIEANLFDIELDLLETIPKDKFGRHVDKLKEKTTGKLIIEAYAPSTVGAANFRHFLNELRIKKGFIPDVIYVDYINLCISTRYKSNSGLNSYTIIKMVAEELRAIAVDYNVPLITATQTNRTGYASSDIGLEDTAESFGLPATADFMFSISQEEDMKVLGEVLFKQLKNRFRDVEYMKKFILGVQKSKMRFFELEQTAQTTMHSKSKEEDNKKPKFGQSKKENKFSKFNKRG